jgi:methanogenic corrinoid protein MtbC1
MVSLPIAQRTAAFDLCGEEATALEREFRSARRAGDDLPQRKRSEELARLVEGQIIPRLMMAHQSTPEIPPDGRLLSRLGVESTEKLALYSLSFGHETLLAVVGGLLQQGVTLEEIYLDLLAPAARRVGDFWLEDRVSYADVTIALGRLQQVVRALSVHETGETAASGARAALFAAAPGEQHTFGLAIIEEFFRRAGWRTWTEVTGSIRETVSAAQAHDFDLFGVTASGDAHLDQIATMIMSVRRASRNRDISVLVGGRLFNERPELVAMVGADGMASDAREAVLKAEGAVRQLARR